ncbi:sulfotransferase [Halofilum ochraceum]|uniref:sulfotransferase n=1 Tax=Halofilum ochraceum TaxID=1611323 RepID=UPI00083472E3|nr:sulfotransferase [Halofilum ochraceum]
MAILEEYSRYLEHFGETVPLRELHEQPEARGLCGLRHDVDYDIDVALEMAYWEHQAGARATYFLLPTAPYWTDERLAEKCLQLQDYGHEIGLHVNAMAQWAGGEIEDPAQTIAEQLQKLRESGVPVTGIAAHGDRRCYEHSVSNYWCFSELKPYDTFANEDGRTAEGPYESDHNRRRLHYPASHEALRPDGCRYPLWSIPMAKFGIDYHAWHLEFDRYFSDSGGDWTRSPDPLSYARGQERWQVLIHPIHWRGPPRLYFFLSPARSGSKWLSEVLQQATPLEARHEYILNQEYHNGDAAQKATAAARMLEEEPERVETLLGDAWEEISQISKDYAEVNVYLPSFINDLKRFFPAATYVHLRRNPANVVRSLMQRDWYDTPEDHAHPRLRHENVAAMTRLERVCEYVAEVNERLIVTCNSHISLEKMASGPDALETELQKLGIPYHQRLGADLIGRTVNASKSNDFPSYPDWTIEQKRQFAKIGGGVNVRLGYGEVRPRIGQGWRRAVDVFWGRFLNKIKRALGNRPKTGQYPENIRINSDRLYCGNCDVSFAAGKMVVVPYGEGRHAYVTIGGSRWNEMATTKNTASGWPTPYMMYIQGELRKEAPRNSCVTIWALSYAKDGKQIYKRRIGVLDKNRESIKFAFAPHPSSHRFDVALHISKSESASKVDLGGLELRYKSYG